MTARIGMLVVVALILIGAHGIIIYYFSSHLALSTAIVSSVIILVLIQHLGVLGPLLVVFRRRSKRGRVTIIQQITSSLDGNDERANDHRHDVHRIDAGQ